MSTNPRQIMPAIATYYQRGEEQHRLSSGKGQLEFARTQDLLQRHLPLPPATIVDVGGGAGVYAFWLAELGYQVHLIDAMPLHIEQARQTVAESASSPLSSMEVGDARVLNAANETADVVLLMGPLYHLIDRADRLLALHEAHRILRVGGIVCAVGISRFASLMDGMVGGLLLNTEFAEIMEQDLRTGQHRNPNHRDHYFTEAFFHHPDELSTEVVEAGFSLDALLAVEGPGNIVPNLTDYWDDTGRRQTLLNTVRALESEPSLLGISAHILAVGRKS